MTIVRIRNIQNKKLQDNQYPVECRIYIILHNLHNFENNKTEFYILKCSPYVIERSFT